MEILSLHGKTLEKRQEGRKTNIWNNIMIAGIPFVLAGQLKTNTPHYIHFF
jgi:hypothetical protein